MSATTTKRYTIHFHRRGENSVNYHCSQTVSASSAREARQKFLAGHLGCKIIACVES